MNWAKIEEITYSECDNPHELLGPHKQGSKMLVQAFFPGAEKVTIHWKKTGQVGEAFLADVPMELADEEGYFAALINAGKMAPYEYVVEYGKTEEREAHRMICGDAYRHVPQITKEDMDRFAVGVHYTIYEKLGAHPMELDGESGTYFAVWAPNAMRISVVGDFNGWDGRIHQMRRLGDSGIFELFIPGAEAGDCYKYELKIKGGLTYLKADPYGNAAQKRPETASVIADLRDFSWDDSEFLKKRESYQCGNAPVSVYEMYLGSFVTPDEGQDYANYREIAPKVIDYVKKMGYKSFKEFKLAYRLQERKSRESKRIYDDKQVIGALIQLDNEYYQEKLHLAKVMIGNHNNLIFTGVGNSGLIGAYGARIFSSAGKYANVINDPFMRINASMEDTVIIALSISGKTPELLRIVESCKTFGACIISITANMKSPLALMSDISIPYFLKIDNIDQIDLTSQILAVAIIERLARND